MENSLTASRIQVQEHPESNIRVLLNELKECSSKRNLQRGQKLHAEALKNRTVSCINVASALVNMYAKCGSMGEAKKVFDTIQKPDVVAWTILLRGYVDNGEGVMALELFEEMMSRGSTTPNSYIWLAVIKACASLASKLETNECLQRGRLIHSRIDCPEELHVQSALIDMYAKCRCMTRARLVFDCMTRRDVVAWNALILGYTENGQGLTALDLYSKMKCQGFVPDFITYVAALKACTSLSLEQDGSNKSEYLVWGKQIHSDIRCSSHIMLQNTLIDMYASCGSMVDAREVFDGIKHPTVVSWNVLIFGYANNGVGDTAIHLFARMKSRCYEPDAITFIAVIKACSLTGALESGRKIHAEMVSKAKCDPRVVSCLVDFYSKCGSLQEAQEVFDSHPQTRGLSSWNALLTGYSSIGEMEAVFEVFQKMQDEASIHPNDVTFLCILSCCSHAGLVENAREFFDTMVTKYRITPNVEHYNCMLDILGRSNKLDDAMALLRSMPSRPNSVTWLTLLGACRKWKNVELGSFAFKSMRSLGEAHTSAYVLMAQIYGSRGMWEEQSIVLGLRKHLKCFKYQGQACWTSTIGEVHTFLNHVQIFVL